ncbi:hypothetical protein FRB99_008222 [Tulasnella sp. 403]|nr:hypothetical protein FRB99_008222 [Tulasnella sp. 403]
MSKTANVLLTPSESNAFSSFLSAMDSFDPNNPTSVLSLSAEWNMYSAALSNHIQLPQGREELAKATKDLIGTANSPPAPHPYGSNTTNTPAHPPALQPLLTSSRFQNDARTLQSFLQDAHSWPSLPPGPTVSARQDANPSPSAFYGSTSSVGPRSAGENGQSTFQKPSLPNLSTISIQSASSSSSATPRSLTTPTSASTTPSGSQFQPSRKRSSLDFNHSHPSSGGSELGSNKRQRVSPASASGGTASSSTNIVSLGSESTTISPTSQQVSRTSASASSSRNPTKEATTPPPVSASTSSSSTVPTPPATSRPPLLSASQKKLNHIHSEQKRRANIRRGYDALCEVVPALRDAIRAEEAACASTGKKRGRGRLLGEDGEKLDGRAGPRSESVVLQKTIEYMTELLNQRSSLLERLQVARGSLPPGHPALIGPADRPWERVWNGGIGLPLNGDALDEAFDDDGSDDE